MIFSPVVLVPDRFCSMRFLLLMMRHAVSGPSDVFSPGGGGVCHQNELQCEFLALAQH